MISHLLFLNIIYFIRSLGGLALAGLFLYYSNPQNIPSNPFNTTLSRFHALKDGDTTMFLIIGVVVGLISAVRLLHSLYTMWGLRASKKAGWRKGIFNTSFLKKSRLLGLTLSWLDLIDLTFFPVTTACGLYGLLVYGHVDIIDFYEVRYVKPRPAPG